MARWNIFTLTLHSPDGPSTQPSPPLVILPPPSATFFIYLKSVHLPSACILKQKECEHKKIILVSLHFKAILDMGQGELMGMEFGSFLGCNLN